MLPMHILYYIILYPFPGFTGLELTDQIQNSIYNSQAYVLRFGIPFVGQGGDGVGPYFNGAWIYHGL